jgi:hypothetical protein
MTQAGITLSNFVLSGDPEWYLVGGTLVWPNLPNTDAVQVDVTNAGTPGAGFTITLTGFTDIGGLPLGGQTSFAYSL